MEVEQHCVLPWMDAYADLLGSVSKDGQRILRLPDCEGRNSSLVKNRIEWVYYVDSKFRDYTVAAHEKINNHLVTTEKKIINSIYIYTYTYTYTYKIYICI